MDKASIRQELDHYVRVTAGMITELQAHNIILLQMLVKAGLIDKEQYREYLSGFRRIIAEHGENTTVTDKALDGLDALTLDSLLKESNNEQ